MRVYNYNIKNLVNPEDFSKPFFFVRNYPFGMLLPYLSHSESDGYRYSFNGMEKDDEVKQQSGTSYDFGNRMYDPRLGKFISRDKLANKYAGQSPYVFAGNTPIWAMDANGDSVLFYSAKGHYLGYSNDNQRYKDKNLLVIIDSKNVTSFKKQYEIKTADRKPNGTTSVYTEAITAGLADMGSHIYDVNAFTDFFDKYSKLKKDLDGSIVPYKGEFPPEWQANLQTTAINKGKYNELNVISPIESTAQTDNDPEACFNQDRSSGHGSFHIHSGDMNPQGPGAPGDFNYARSHSNGEYNVVQSKTQFNIFVVSGGGNREGQQYTMTIQIDIHAKDGKLSDVKFTGSSNKNAGTYFE